MKNWIKNGLYALLLIGALGLYSCSEEVEFAPEKDTSSKLSSTPVSPLLAQNCNLECEDCDNLVTNGSFEIFNGSLGSSNALSITGNSVPPWYEVRGTPNIMDGNLPMTASMYTNAGFDGTNILHMNENPFQDPDLGEAAAIDVDILADPDLTYCVSFLNALGIKVWNNQPNAPGNIEVRVADGVPQTTLKPEINWPSYQNQFVGSAATSVIWQSASYQFTVSQAYSQLVFDAQSQSVGSGSVTRVLLDDVKLSCQTNALQGITSTTNPDGSITLSADFQGLPANVSIVDYEWCGLGQPNPTTATVTIQNPGNDISVCLKIKDSRGCCASVCDTIITACDSLNLSSCCTIDIGSGKSSVLGTSKNREDALSAISASSLSPSGTVSPSSAVCDPCKDGWYPVWVEENNSPIGLPGDPCYVVEWFDDQGNLLFTGWAFAANVDVDYTVRVTNSCNGCIWEESFTYSCCRVPTKPNCKLAQNGYSVLSWDPVAGATGYQVQITINDPNCCEKPSTLPYSLPLINIPAGTTSFIPQVSYLCASWSVRAVCNGSFSDYTTPQCICKKSIGIGTGKD